MKSPLPMQDNYHTMDDMYMHRNHLFVALMRAYPEMSWRANNHHDGTGDEGWIVCGMNLPVGDITYHLPAWMWTLMDYSGISTYLRAPRKWDGHTPDDVLDRITKWCRMAEDTYR